MREVISTQKAGAPMGTYSQAIKVGNLVWTAGMGPLESGTLLFAGDIAKQTVKTLENLEETLNAAGTSLAHAVRVGAFIDEIGKWATFNAAYKAFFARFNVAPPARTTIAVGGFPEGMCVEIDVVAVVP
ncbi:RidA family protein [Candidatus Poribacteria bacterium]|nr:RidA family protein [Candidatus Poribacteria bacterium]